MKSHKKIIKVIITILVLIAMYIALKYMVIHFDRKAGRPIISKDYLTIRYKDKIYIPYSGRLSSDINEESGIVASIEGNHSLIIRFFEPDFIRDFIGVDCLHLQNGSGIEYEIYCVEGFEQNNSQNSPQFAE